MDDDFLTITACDGSTRIAFCGVNDGGVTHARKINVPKRARREVAIHLGGCVKGTVLTIAGNACLLGAGVTAILLIPAFAMDAQFWIPALAGLQLWMCCVWRAGRR